MAETTDSRPVYEWEAAQPGDTAPDKQVEVPPALVALYARTSGDASPLYTDEAFARGRGLEGLAVPYSMAMRMAPGKRATIMRYLGYRHPVRPTPFSHWQCETFAPVRVGDTITSHSVMEQKYERNGRKYLVWKVEGRNQRGELVVVHRATNMWDGGKPADRER
jgi:acyl dehydratase